MSKYILPFLGFSNGKPFPTGWIFPKILRPLRSTFLSWLMHATVCCGSGLFFRMNWTCFEHLTLNRPPWHLGDPNKEESSFLVNTFWQDKKILFIPPFVQDFNFLLAVEKFSRSAFPSLAILQVCWPTYMWMFAAEVAFCELIPSASLRPFCAGREPAPCKRKSASTMWETTREIERPVSEKLCGFWVCATVLWSQGSCKKLARCTLRCDTSCLTQVRKQIPRITG